jgi:rsbT co-antagonist protein RsbR
LPSPSKNTLAHVLSSKQSEIGSQWQGVQAKGGRTLSASETQDTKRKSAEFIDALQKAAASDDTDDINAPAWSAMRDLLADLSASRAKSGYTPTETASFIFSFKEPLFAALQGELGKDPVELAAAIIKASQLLDKLGLLTMESFQRTREDIISRQQQEMLELSTPVVRLWENILALPLIGTLDSARTQIVMQNLLEAIVSTRSDYAIIDITGVPIVDTLVAQHLLKTVAAARLMGADCMISGIRPQIAQTIIHLGVDLSEVTTKATLADAFAVALKRGGFRVVKAASKETERTAGEK